MLIILVAALAAGSALWAWFSLREKIPVKQSKKETEPIASTVINYSDYKFQPGEYMVSVVLAAAVWFAVGYTFYKNIAFALFLSLAGFLYPLTRKKTQIRKRKAELGVQFRQALQAMASSLSAGRSVENCFIAAVQDLKLQYMNPKTYILQEFERIHHKIMNGESAEQALQEFSERAGLDEVTEFTDVFVICKRTGGNLVEVVRKTAQIIGDKMETQQEIAVMLAQKKFESKVLGAAPIAIVALLSFSSPDYMAPLYGQASGAAMMTVFLLLLAACLWLTNKIMDIRV